MTLLQRESSYTLAILILGVIVLSDLRRWRFCYNADENSYYYSSVYVTD